MATVTPTNQTSTLDPYSGSLFEYNNVDSRIYLSRAINSILDIYGRDVVIDGLKVTGFSYISNTLHVTFSPGLAIADQTLIETPDPVITTYDTTGMNMSNASVIFFIRFQYLQQFASNQFGINSIYINSSGATLASDGFNSSTDRICLAVFDFDPSGLVVTQRITNTYIPLAMRSSAASITVDSNVIPIYPISTIADITASIIKQALA